ncbi:type II toxin-antitoxin system MqsA family antitoxin [Pseudomonas akapageensis]|uniref:type II toxin-antitoxin system MqsA family antitoxin n=1 Tax=Pseudomonas akapageensis TaxID=2609961 RepID=UPI001408C03F|nr:type II toxin-antitoxin system MqsA family antitoxin [Pseudomonas akapageensis]
MKCPVCGSPEMVRDTRDIPFTFKSESIVIPNVNADFCPDCGEVVLDVDESMRLSSLLLDIHQIRK